MVGLVEFSGMVTALRNAADITKALIDVKVDQEVKDKISKLQQSIISAQASALSAQADHSSLLEEARALKAQIAEAEDWKREAERYALKQFPTGALVYELKSEAAGSEPVHVLCPNCYADRKKSIMQVKDASFEGFQVACPRCKFEIVLRPKNVELQREARRKRAAQLVGGNHF